MLKHSSISAHYDSISPTVYTVLVPQGTVVCRVAVQVEFGVVYSCLEDKMFTARRGRGAFCNGEPLQVSHQTGQ